MTRQKPFKATSSCKHDFELVRKCIKEKMFYFTRCKNCGFEKKLTKEKWYKEFHEWRETMKQKGVK
jgi:hypothetical protein